MIGFFLVVLIVAIIFMAVDYVILKRFMTDSIKRVNDIFDGMKTFFLVTLVDSITSAFKSDDSNDDDPELHCS